MVFPSFRRNHSQFGAYLSHLFKPTLQVLDKGCHIERSAIEIPKIIQQVQDSHRFFKLMQPFCR